MARMASFERRLRPRRCFAADSSHVTLFHLDLDGWIFFLKAAMHNRFVHFCIPLRVRLNRKLGKMSPANIITDTSLAPLARPPTPVLQQVKTLSTSRLKYVDIGINLGDPVFQGIYHGKRAHESDLEDVIQRAAAAGCLKMMITGSDLKQSRIAIKLAENYRTSNYRCLCGFRYSSYFLFFLNVASVRLLKVMIYFLLSFLLAFDLLLFAD